MTHIALPKYTIRVGNDSGVRGRRTKLWASLILGILIGMFIASCGENEPELTIATGRSLELYTSTPKLVERVAFLDGEGRHRVIRPIASNRNIAVVEVTVVNRSTTIIPLLIDSAAVELGNRRTRRVEAVNVFEAAEIIDAPDEEEGKHVPFLWGEVALERCTQVTGWMVFDVPKGLILGSLWWNEVDDIIADYIQYR